MSNIAPQLITDRLYLDEITEQDTTLIVTWRSNPEVYKYFLLPHPLEIEEHLNWFHYRYTLDENCLNWMATIKSQKERIGVFGIKKKKGRLVTVEVSYLLAPGYQGKGYAGEALEKIIEFAKNEWKAIEAVAEIHVENKESLKFATNLGFERFEKKGNFAVYKRRL